MATCPRCLVRHDDSVAKCPQDGEGLVPDEALPSGDAELREGDAVGEYRVEGKLGQGGFGAVYRANQPVIGKQVAIKVLSRRFSSDPEMVSRFIAEARAVNQIRHRHIIDIFSFGRLPDGRSYYVMELLGGVTLDRYLRDRGRLAPAAALPILRAIAKALDAAHAKGIAHRDLKPENVFLADDDGEPFPKLLDFGIAKLLQGDTPLHHKTQTGVPMGTPYYMSPEQCRGRAVDHRCDVYSFGILTYQLVTGKLPFTGQDYMDVVLKQLSEAPEPPSRHRPALSPAMDAAILAMLEKDPARRPATVAGALAPLEAAVAAGPPVPDDDAAPAAIALASTQAEAPPLTPEMKAALGSAETLAHTPVATPAPVPALVSAPAAARRPRRGGLVGGVVAVLVLGGAGGAWMMRGGGEEGAAPKPSPPGAPAGAPSPPPAPAPAPKPTPAPPPAPAPAPSTTVELEVKGTPPGTQVFGPGGALLGTAPGKIRVPRADTPIELRFVKKGYEPRVQSVVPRGDGTLAVELTKVRKPRPGGGTAGGGEIPEF